MNTMIRQRSYWFKHPSTCDINIRRRAELLFRAGDESLELVPFRYICFLEDHAVVAVDILLGFFRELEVRNENFGS